MDNRTIARRLTEHADALNGDRNLYRRRAYRRAAETMLALDEPAEQIIAVSGRKGLERLRNIGRHLAGTIDLLVRTGELRTLTAEGGDTATARSCQPVP